MSIGLLGRKLGMTQLFTEKGETIPVTVIEGGPCFVTQLKSQQKDGYSAVQIGFCAKKRGTNRPLSGHFQKAKTEPLRFLREIRVQDVSSFQAGQSLTAEQFKLGDYVDIIGVTIGKGFQGGVKRWGWSGGGASHGSMQHRQPGSIGSNTTPGRVLRGHHLPGHMGAVRRTVQNLQVIKVDAVQNLLVVKGSIPGAVNSFVEIRPAKKR